MAHPKWEMKQTEIEKMKRRKSFERMEKSFIVHFYMHILCRRGKKKYGTRNQVIRRRKKNVQIYDDNFPDSMR